MKKLFLSMLLLITATLANAQQRDDENFSQRLFEARLAEVCLHLNLSDEQKTKFAPIYEQYCNEMRELKTQPGPGAGKPRRPGMRPDGPHHRPDKPGMRPDKHEKHPGGPRMHPDNQQDKEQISDAERVKQMKKYMEKQKKAQDIRIAYTEKFATVLSDKQLVKFYEIESDIQEKMHRRAFKGRQHDR